MTQLRQFWGSKFIAINLIEECICDQDNPEFYVDLHKMLTDLGVVPKIYDSNVYVLINYIGKTILVRAVDDMPMRYTGGKVMLDLVLGGAKNSYEITVDDPIETILGLEVYRDQPNKRMHLRSR